MAIIAALHDPLTVFVPDDLTDVMTPDDDGTDGRPAGVRAVVRPGSREVVLRAGVATNLRAHVPAAPSRRPSGCRIRMIPVVVREVMVVIMVRSCFRIGRIGAKQRHSSEDLTHYYVLQAVEGSRERNQEGRVVRTKNTVQRPMRISKIRCADRLKKAMRGQNMARVRP